MTIVNAYTVAPDEIEVGDVMLFIIKAEVQYEDHDGKLRYRIYRCLWGGNPDDIPQGSQVNDMKAVCEQVFPSLAAVAKPE